MPLLERALTHLLHHRSHERPLWLRGGLVVVTDEPTDVRRAICGAGGDAVRIWLGPQVGREIARAPRDDGLAALLARLKAGPVCIIESVDRLGPADVQHAFVRLFDAIVDAGLGLCLTLASHPDAAHLEPPLASRLCGGLVVRMPPTTRPRIDPASQRAPSLRRLLNAVARYHDLTVAELIGPARSRAVVKARCIAMHLARQLTGASLYAIGRACGGRDHTTVMHGVRTMERQLACDPACAADVARLAAALTGTGGDARRRARVDSQADSPRSAKRHSCRQAAGRSRGN